MTRELFLGLLKSVPGVTANKKTYEVQEGFEVSVLVAHVGGASSLNEIKSLVADADYLEARLADRRHVFLSYENITMISSKPPRGGDEPRRTGFL